MKYDNLIKKSLIRIFIRTSLFLLEMLNFASKIHAVFDVTHTTESLSIDIRIQECRDIHRNIKIC